MAAQVGAQRRMTPELWRAVDVMVEALSGEEKLDPAEIRRAMSFLSAHRDEPDKLFELLKRQAGPDGDPFIRSGKTRGYRRALHRAVQRVPGTYTGNQWALILGATARLLHHHWRVEGDGAPKAPSPARGR